MKHLLKLNEYVQEIVEKPLIKKALSTPMTVEMLLKKISQRFNKLISLGSNESLEDNLGLSDDFMRSLKGQFKPEDVQGAMQDSKDILELLSSIRNVESEMSNEDKVEKAMEIVSEIFDGKGFDINKLDFKLKILDDSDLMDAKSNIIGVEPERFKEVKQEIESENPKLKKEIDVRAIQNALTQGFASSIKDDFITGDTEIEGVSFGDYYKLMDKTFGLYSKVPKELMHQVMTQSPALGRAELVWNEDTNKYTIEASGYTILILVHEIIKGILELISMHRDPELNAEDEDTMMSLSGTQYSEREGLQYGPGMVSKFKEFFTKVEDNLLEQREIRERNPAMMLNVLSRFYKLDDDLFLRVSKAIFSDDSNKPYELFEEFYIDGLEGTGFRRNDDGPTGPSDNPDNEPSAPGDDALRDLLNGAGISLNQDPSLSEANKHIFGWNLYQLLESKKDILDKWSQTTERDIVVDYISKFDRITNNPKGELKDILTSDIPGVRVDNDINNRINIEQYDFSSLRALVDYVSRIAKIPVVSSLKQGDINPAISTIQDKLGLEKTGFYNSELESKIREFQRGFKDSISNDYNWQEIYDKYQNVGLTNLSAKEKIQLSKSASFITTTEDIIRQKEEQLKNKVQQSTLEEDPSTRQAINDDIIIEYEKISNIKKELKTIKAILSGGLQKPSGKMDQATIGALTFDKGIAKLEGLGNNGTLKPVGGEIVEDNEHYRIHRILSFKFCVDTRKSFEKLLRENGANTGGYSWCIASGDSWYSTYRRNANERQTIYFIENKKRAVFEAKKISEYLITQGAQSLGRSYTTWRGSSATPRLSPETTELVANENARVFYDNYHIAVLFAKDWKPNENTYWLVGASNNGQWGDKAKGDGEHLTLKQCAEKIWPSTENESIRRQQRSTGGGGSIDTSSPQVTQDIIDLPFYYVPSDEELGKLERNILLPMDVSKSERTRDNQAGNSDVNNINISANRFEAMNYDEKEEWLQLNWFTQQKITEFLNNRNTKSIDIRIWRILPTALKELYIRTTVGSSLSKMHLDEIKDNSKLLKMYQDFIKRRLVGEGGQGGIIDTIKDSKTLDDLRRNFISEEDIRLVSEPYDFNKIKKDYVELRNKINELPPNTKVSTRTSLLKELRSKKIKIDQYMNIISRYRESLSQAIKNIKKDNPKDILSSNKNIQDFKDIIYGIDLSKILQSANSLLDQNTTKKDDNGNKLKLFSDIIEKDKNIDQLATVWDLAPNPFDKLVKIRSIDTKKANALINKMVSILLTRAEAVPDLSTRSGSADYINQLENVFQYIKNMNPKHMDIINLMLTRVMIYYKIKDYSKKLNGSDAKKLYLMYDSIFTKFPELLTKFNWSKSDSFKGKRKESSSTGATRPGHTEELG